MDPRLDDVQSKSRVQQPATFFSMNCLLCSRVDVGEGEIDYYDQDVDAYLEHLMKALDDPMSLAGSRRYLSRYDAEVIKRLAKSRTARLRYHIYRTDSDFLLLSVGTYSSPPIRRGRGRQEPIEEGYIGRGKTYYHFAYSYSQRHHLPNLAMSEVLEKLVLGFERYAGILAQMRADAHPILDGLLTADRTILERVVGSDEDAEAIRQKQDELLEAISDYQRTRSGDSRRRVALIVEELNQLRPGFAYDLDADSLPI